MMPRVEIADLGAWTAGGGLIAEFDAESQTIRVHARAVERVRQRLGAAEAARFVACAVAHERHHAAHPSASEADAHAAAQAWCGVDPRFYEAVLREPA